MRSGREEEVKQSNPSGYENPRSGWRGKGKGQREGRWKFEQEKKIKRPNRREALHRSARRIDIALLGHGLENLFPLLRTGRRFLDHSLQQSQMGIMIPNRRLAGHLVCRLGCFWLEVLGEGEQGGK